MTSRTILVIEDDSELREEIARALRSRGYVVPSAADGDAALKSLGEINAPCLILVDLMMPNMDGWEFLDLLNRLSKNGKFSHRAVVISGSAAASEIAHQHGARFLAKPFSMSDLLAIVLENDSLPL
jgi:CheY-like chemotaxis protein